MRLLPLFVAIVAPVPALAGQSIPVNMTEFCIGLKPDYFLKFRIKFVGNATVVRGGHTTTIKDYTTYVDVECNKGACSGYSFEPVYGGGKYEPTLMVSERLIIKGDTMEVAFRQIGVIEVKKSAKTFSYVRRFKSSDVSEDVQLKGKCPTEGSSNW